MMENFKHYEYQNMSHGWLFNVNVYVHAGPRKAGNPYWAWMGLQIAAKVAYVFFIHSFTDSSSLIPNYHPKKSWFTFQGFEPSSWRHMPLLYWELKRFWSLYHVLVPRPDCTRNFVHQGGRSSTRWWVTIHKGYTVSAHKAYNGCSLLEPRAR